MTRAAPRSALSFPFWALGVAAFALVGCPEATSPLAGSEMSRAEVAAAISDRLGRAGRPQPLSVRSTERIRVGHDRCPRRGLFFPEELRVTGPHLQPEDLFQEIFPAEELGFAWCSGVGVRPRSGSVYAEDFMYENNRCGSATNLSRLRALRSLEGKARIHLRGICHTLKSQLPQLGFFVEVGEALLAHPDLPGAKPLRTLFVKSLDLHVLPLPKKKSKGIRASLVAKKPLRRILTMRRFLGQGKGVRPSVEGCESVLPLRFNLQLHFNFFNSAVVKKSKGVGRAEVDLRLTFVGGEKVKVLDKRREVFQTDDFTRGPKLPFTSGEHGEHLVEVLLDERVIAKKSFFVRMGSPRTQEKEGQPVGSCPLELDDRDSAVKGDTIGLSL